MILASGTISTYVTQYMTTYAKTTLNVSSSLRSRCRCEQRSPGHRCGAGRLAADRLGRKPVMICPQLVVLVADLSGFLWIVQEPGAWSLLFGFGISVVLSIIAVHRLLRAFPKRCRRTSGAGVFATIYAVAIATFGGTAQLVVTWLLHVDGDPLAPCWYLLLAAIVGSSPLSLMPETAREGRRDLSALECALFHVAKA